jgi:ribosome-binding factor A
MAQHTRERMEEVLRELAADFLHNDGELGVLLTVTRVVINSSLSEATIFFTTMPVDAQERTLARLSRREGAMLHHAIKNMRVKYVPRIHLAIDYGERNRQRIDSLLANE